MRRLPVAALLGAGVLMLQIGWMLAIPAFGGIDEFDHAYRAASVARGHVSPHLTPNETGLGDLIPVPSDLVKAAENRCSILPYTGHDNCHSAGQTGRDGEVLVASTSSRYNPVYPLLVGVPALPFDGATALYIMRAVTILLCDLLLLASYWIIGRIAATPWPRIATLTAITPVLLYATSNAAPNGVQMSAGLLMWSAGLVLSRGERARSAIWAFAVATMVLITVHSTGPMWALAIVAFLGLWPGTMSAAKSLWETERRACMQVIGLVGLVGAADVYWALSRSTNLNWGHHHYPPLKVTTLVHACTLWVFQAIGAIPFRDQYVPTFVFAMSLVVFGFLLFFGLRLATWRQRSVILGIGVAFFAVPVVLTIASYHSLGVAWQGRYSLPFACGIVLLAGWVLEDADPRSPIARVLEFASPLAFCSAQAVAIIGVADDQHALWPSGHGLGSPPTWLLATLCVVASAMICSGFAELSARHHKIMGAEPRVRSVHVP